jgi:hypothetical protein
VPAPAQALENGVRQLSWGQMISLIGFGGVEEGSDQRLAMSLPPS